jgi:iron complex outermembrane receptor protein
MGVGEDAGEVFMRYAVSVVLLSLAFNAVAQDDAVVITATRFRDTKRDLPVGVTLITSDDLRKSATSNLPEILAQFGLVHVRDNTGSPSQQVDLRGFGITGDQNTLILLDGVRLSENEQAPAQLSTIPLESIERIEVVRGSGAVLYGGGATGGTINIITRRPQAGTTRMHALGRAGGYGTEELRAGFSRAGENLGFGLDVSHEDTDGYRRHNKFRQTNVAASAQAFGESGRGYLRLSAGDQALALPGALTEAQIAADPRQAGAFLGDGERNDGAAALGGAWNIGRHEVAADLAYRDKHASTFFLPSFFVDTRVKQSGFTPRARLRFDALGRVHDVSVGADIVRWDYDNRNAPAPAEVRAPFSHRTGDQDNRALFGQANLWLTPSTRVVLGARSEHTEQTLQETLFPIAKVSASHTVEAYEAALRQGLGRGWSTYAKYGSSFRLATFDDLLCTGVSCTLGLLEPQTAKAGELGVELERGGVRARAAVYDMRLENEIYFSPLVFANLNLSPTRRRGAELEAAWRAMPSLELRGSLGLLEATFRSGIFGGVDVAGKRVPLVPRAIATAGLSWTFASRSRFNANARYVGPQRYDNDQANVFREQPAYTLVDVKLEHRVGRADLGLEVRNLFDKQYYSYGIWNGANSFFAYPQPERAIYLSLAYRLD